MLDDHGVKYTVRDYLKEPLSVDELKALFAKLQMTPQDLLRKHDPAYKELGLTGREASSTLIKHMSQYPGLLQRPIGVRGKKALVGRPVERLLEL